jgi:hypothetical protein
MIIDGKLVISKKKKAVLIAELKEKKFRAFPKSTDAAKAGELEAFMENEEEEEDASSGSNGYDYLLGVSSCSFLRHHDMLTYPDGSLVVDTRASREVAQTNWREGSGNRRSYQAV